MSTSVPHSDISLQRTKKQLRIAHRQRRQKETQEQGLIYKWPDPPKAGETIEVASGIFWLQLPMPMALDHINCYLIDDGDSWAIIDSGLNTNEAQEQWRSILDNRTKEKPLGKVILTHHHPDHVGMAGWIIENYGGQLYSTRTTWTIARTMQINPLVPLPNQLFDFFGKAGLEDDQRDYIFKNGFAGAFKKVYPLPIINYTLLENSHLQIGSRNWKIVFGHGHAPDHACLWNHEENILIAGDQILPQISSVVGAWPLELQDDPIADWISSCKKLMQFVNPETLILPGHNEPFLRGDIRLQQLVHHHEKSLNNILQIADKPFKVADTFSILFHRKITPDLANFATMEARAHINHLLTKNKLKIVSDASCDTNSHDWYVAANN